MEKKLDDMSATVLVMTPKDNEAASCARPKASSSAVDTRKMVRFSMDGYSSGDNERVAQAA